MFPRPDRPHDQLLSRQMKTSDSDCQCHRRRRRRLCAVADCHFDRRRRHDGEQVEPAGVARVGRAGGVCGGVGLVDAPARQICRGGVCVQPADTSRAADVGRADQPLHLATIAGCPAGSRARTSSRPDRRIGLPASRIRSAARRSRWLASCCQVAAVIVRSLTNSSVAFSSACCRALRTAEPASDRPQRRARRKSRPACRASRPALRAIRRWCCSSYSQDAQMRDAQDHQLGIDRRGSRPRSSRPP